MKTTPRTPKVLRLFTVHLITKLGRTIFITIDDRDTAAICADFAKTMPRSISIEVEEGAQTEQIIEELQRGLRQ